MIQPCYSKMQIHHTSSQHANYWIQLLSASFTSRNVTTQPLNAIIDPFASLGIARPIYSQPHIRQDTEDLHDWGLTLCANPCYGYCLVPFVHSALQQPSHQPDPSNSANAQIRIGSEHEQIQIWKVKTSLLYYTLFANTITGASLILMSLWASSCSNSSFATHARILSVLSTTYTIACVDNAQETSENRASWKQLWQCYQPELLCNNAPKATGSDPLFKVSHNTDEKQ